jgi:hypothetical protein
MKPADSLNDPNSHHAPPPPIKSNRARVIVLAVAGAIVAIILIAVAFNIDRNASQRQRRENPKVVELIPPGELDRDSASGDFNRITTNLSELGAENTWIQTTRDGKLAQQYRFASHEPNPEGLPPGWSKVHRPQIQIFMSDDRVLTLQSQTALLRATSRNLESGKMTGNVVIRLYEVHEGQAFAADDAPVMEAMTEEASFDNIQGEIRCDGAIDIQTPTAHLPGHGLRVHINEVANRIEWLRLEQVQTIRLAAIEEDENESEASTSPANHPRTTDRQRRADSDRPRQPRGQQAQIAFYRLTLQNKVHVQQRGQRMEWSADGDNLHITFSMRGAMLDQTAATRPTSQTQSAASLTSAIIAFAIAATPGDSISGLFTPSDDDIFITCGGGMTMVPLGNADVRPPSPDETHLELVGAPAQLRSVSDAIDIRCQSMGYLTKQQRIIVKGTPATPARLDAPQAKGEFTEFWLNRLKHVGGFVGAGWMILRERSDPAITDALLKDLRIEWQDQVDLTFDPAPVQDDARESFGRLRTAAFAGKVNVLSEELMMNADAMTVTLPARVEGESNDQRTLESIVANGKVHAVSLADEGSLACEHLDVRFIRTETGQTIPERLSATGEVMAQDRDQQIIWCDQMDVDFEPALASVDAGAESAHARTRTKTMVAEGNVQARLQDGVRAFGDRMEATGEQLIVLTGSDVMVLRDRGAIHGGKRLELHKADMSAEWAGAGQFTYFATAIASDDPARIERPALDAIDLAVNPIHTRATWTQSMHYDGTINDGAGALKLTGNVLGDSRPSALEHNTLKSLSLTLQFARIADNVPEAQTPAAQRNERSVIGQGKRDLKLFIAEGNAEIESHTWLMADHSDVSRVFFISGPYIEYDDQTFEAKVNGEGALLVRDERPQAPAENEADAHSRSFDAKGTTQFKWTDHLHMTRIDGPLYQIQMIGDVSAIHESLDKSRSWMRGQQLVAVVERTATAAAVEPKREAAFDLGGAMELRKITGAGGIVINTPAREITTDSIDYDYPTGVAALIANQGNTVFVKTTGNPHPIRAQSMSWNLREDKITVTNLRGTAPR